MERETIKFKLKNETLEVDKEYVETKAQWLEATLRAATWRIR